MANTHCVVLWVDGDGDPNEVDWEKQLEDSGFALSPGEDGEKSVAVTTFPWSGVYHEVRWWISKPLTLDEWSQLDHEEGELLSKIVGDHFNGTAGPIPFGEGWQKAREEWEEKEHQREVEDERP